MQVTARIKSLQASILLSDTESIDISDNSISGFPEFLSNIGLQFQFQILFLKLNAKYVGRILFR